jgi:hypothetical protein
MLEKMPIRSILLATAMALLGGCASMEQASCDRHEQSTRGVKPVTTYRLIPPKPGQAAPRALPSGSVPLVPTYTQTFKPGFTKPCTSLTLYKDVVIQRSDDADVNLSEVREFYAEDGTLITSSTQDLSDQIKRSGTYVATTPLPVPKSAPPGKYKIVSKLLYERRGSGRSPLLVARTEGFFYIIPPR